MSTQLNTLSICSFLGIEPKEPDIANIQELISHYTRRVPWESAFRIVRRAEVEQTKECPRFPSIFWDDAIYRGGGGTCFESNYAFFTLLQALGYEGYLTINNMQDDGTIQTPNIGCHSAIILFLDDEKWLVDVGIPIHAPLPIRENEETTIVSQFLTYTIRHERENRYQIERTPHPNKNAFTLIDIPIEETAYRERTIRDYSDEGLFLNRVIINKVVDETLWRFNSSEYPLQFQQFVGDQKFDHPISDAVAEEIAQKFAMNQNVLEQALSLVK